jgi:hypothetical protein
MVLRIYPIDADYAKLSHVFAMTVWRCTFAAHRQTFCSIRVGSIGRISEAEVRSLMRMAAGWVIREVIRPVMQATDAVHNSAADADRWRERTFDKGPFARAGCGKGWHSRVNGRSDPGGIIFLGLPDSGRATVKRAWVGPALSQTWSKWQGAELRRDSGPASAAQWHGRQMGGHQ